MKTLWMGLALVVVSPWAVAQDAATCVFVSGGKEVSELKAGEFQDLMVKCRFPAAEQKKGFDRVLYDLRIAETNATASLEGPPNVVNELLKGGEELSLWIVKSGEGKPDMTFGSGSNVTSLTEYPRRGRHAKATVTITVTLQKKTGEVKKTRWNESQNVWEQWMEPIYDGGRVVSRGTLIVHQLPPRTEVQDPAGVFEVKLPVADCDYTMIDERQSQVHVSGVQLALPTGKRPLTYRYVWLDADEIERVHKAALKGRDVLSFVKDDIKNKFVYVRGTRVTPSALEWPSISGCPAHHDFRFFSVPEPWKKDKLGEHECEEFSGLQSGQARFLAGGVTVMKAEARVFLSALWIDGETYEFIKDVYEKKYEPLINATNASFKIVK